MFKNPTHLSGMEHLRAEGQPAIKKKLECQVVGKLLLQIKIFVSSLQQQLLVCTCYF